MILRASRLVAGSLRLNTRLESPKGSVILAWISSLLFALLPSFVQRRLRPDAFKPRHISPTSWLDGLRGVAAFTVYVNHYTARNFVPFQHMYGDHELVNWSSPLQLPFVRVIFCGLPMVHIFFIISGFALSYKPVRLMRNQQYQELHEALSSGTFRRAFRLFLPPVASTFFVMMTAYFGILGPEKQFPTLAEHISDWLAALWQITDSWSWDVLWYPAYDVHLWTIGIEFSHSLLLFVTIMGTSRLRPRIRMIYVTLLIAYCVKCGHWGPAEFLAGFMIAEITLIEKEKRTLDEGLLLPPQSTRIPIKRLIWVIFLIINLLFALFVAGWPNGNVENLTGFAWLYRNTMDPYWTTGGNILIFPWYALGAVQIVLAVHQIPTLQRLFTTPVAQYLGDISFSLYLMHGPLQVIIEPRWVPTAWVLVDGTEKAGMWQYTIAWFIGFITMAPFVVWMSDIFWRFVDVKSVRFARWFESKCIHSDPADYTAVPISKAG